MNDLSVKKLELIFDGIQSGRLEPEDIIDKLIVESSIENLVGLTHEMLLDVRYSKYRSILCGIIKKANSKRSLRVLWAVITDPSSKGGRGSLVDAMGGMNPIDYFENLVDLVVNDNFEVANNSMAVISGLDGFIDGVVLDVCSSKIKRTLLDSIPDWRREALVILLEETEY